jgi:hypothetical protein
LIPKLQPAALSAIPTQPLIFRYGPHREGIAAQRSG